MAWIAAAIAIGIMAVATSAGSFAAAGADASGYLNEGRLMKRGDLHVCPAFATGAEDMWTFAPLGFRPAARRACIVPTYSPGLPVLMAAAMLAGGDRAAYVVVPLTGGLLVWLTFVLARRVWSATTGIAAATLLATSPAFLNQVLQPMSDVPVAAWWTGAVVLALHGSRLAAVASGCLASLAILTRPNLAPLAIAVGLLLASSAGRSSALHSRDRAAAVLLFVAGLIPGLASVALFNVVLYGGPFHSGYGSPGELYDVSYAGRNLSRYVQWTVETQSPIVFVGLLAPLLLVKRYAAVARVLWGLAVFVAAVWASYVFYFVFDEWVYLRFLLPALPVMLVSSLVPFAATIRRPALRVAMGAGVLALALWQVRQAEERGVFRVRREMARYDVAGRYAATQFARGAFVAGEHSGSLWYYTNQPIVRWDLAAPDSLDRILDDLRARGFPAHVVLEAWEVPRFRERFRGASAIGALDWPAAAEVRHRTRVRIFAVEDRARFLAGVTIRTRMVW